MIRCNIKRQIFVSFFALLLVVLSPAITLASSTNNLQSLPLKYNNLSSDTKLVKMTKQAQEAARLLGIESQVNRLIELRNNGKFEVFDQEALRLQLIIIRKVMTAALELRTTSAQLDKEINLEYHAMDKLSRQRDAAVAATNNANFLQLGILSMIIDGPLAESHNKNNVLYANRLNIVSGLMVGGFAALAFIEQRGGVRGSKAPPNMLGQTLGLNAPASEQLSPLLWTYLNSPSPNSDSGMTRREQLLEYWKTAKVLPINIKKQSTMEKVSVIGPHHKWWCESIKLINTRITMLFDLRAMVDLLNTGLVDLVQVMD